MPSAYFTATAAGFEPDDRAHAPWSDDMLHGRFIGGLAARALEHTIGDERWRATRLTVDLFRPAAMDTVVVETRSVRDGRKVRVADAHVQVGGHEVGRVTGVFLPESEDPPGTIWRPHHEPWPDPDSLPPAEDGTGSAEHADWLFRVVTGGMGSAAHSRIWTNDTAPLVDDEPMSPLVRAAVSGDIGCPIANFSDDGLHFINADFTLMLGRYPDGPWIGVESTEQVQADGISMAMATMYDREGVFAMSGGGSLARPPLHH